MDIMFVLLVVGILFVATYEWADRGKSDLLKKKGNKRSIYYSMTGLFILAALVEGISIPLELKSYLSEGRGKEYIENEFYWSIGTFAGNLLLANLYIYLAWKRKSFLYD